MNYRRGHRYKKNWHFEKQRHPKKTKKKRLTSLTSSLSVFTSVLNVDERCRSRDMLQHDTDLSTMVCDNSANVHICNQRNMFVGDIRTVSNQQVATIGGKGHQPSGIGTVKWIWRDNFGKSHEYLVDDVLFFPQSPINILSVTCFARQLDDLTGTGIDTKQLRYRFYWDSNKFSLTIQHPPSNLPEISINEGFALSTVFRALVSIVINVANHPRYGCCFTHMDIDNDIEGNCTDKEHSTCCHGKSVFTTSQNDIVSEFFEIGEHYWRLQFPLKSIF